MSEICNGIDEPVKIMGYADDSTTLTSHRHVRTSENRIQEAIHQITKWADNTGFQISIEKTKSTLFTRKKYQTVNIPTVKIWMKGD
jgi:predicted ATP-grasp superfamily ATP-dependent carboligase